MLTRQSAVLLVCLFGVLGFAGAVLDPFHLTVRAAASPVLTYSQSIAEWRVTDGFIYLSDSCRDASAETKAYVHRRAIHGQSLTRMSDVDQKPACRTFRHSAADASGVYYYNRNLGRLEAIYSDRPTDPPTALATIGDWTRIGSGDGIGALRLDANNVYWIETVYTGEFSPNDVSIKRVSKRGGVPKTLFSYSTASQQSFRGLGVTSKYIWWTDSNGLNRIDSCTVSPCAPGVPRVKTLEHAVSSGDGVVHISGSNVLWWNEDEAPRQIRLTKCHHITGTCTTTPFHTSGGGNTISGLAANGSAAYWVENVANVGSRLLRKPLGGGAAEILIENIRSAAPHLDVDGVYFQTSTDTISRLPFDAAAITREIGLAGWEVTQGVQRLANDVPLVAGKTTYVRLYPTLEDGADVGAATAALHGSRDGEALPGSPIYPINIAIPIRSNRSLADRAFVSGGWLFRLPESWTRTGSELIPQVDTSISLRGVVDPSGAYSGSDRADNNEITGVFSFVAKAPTCVTMRSVVTNNSYQSTFGINVGQVLELTESILPTPKLIAFPKNDPLREIDWCWKGAVYGPFCSTPYELSDDDTVLLTKMGWIDYWADSPSVCFNNNARTLLAGIVHDDAEWDWAGLARTGKDQLLTKVPRYGAPTAITRRNGTAMTMVHEMGHSYDRRHIDCGGPDGPDRNYPYPTDRIDFDLPLDRPELHFGFDPLLRVPVIPSVTADYMSYCSPEWYSDYTWKALFNKTRDPVYVPSPVRLMSAGGDLVRIAGLVDTIAVEGTLDPAWTLPIEAASEEQRQRWEAERTPAWDGDPDGGPYHVQLVGEDGRVLLDQRVELSETEDGDPADLVPFALALTAPVESVARMQLMADDTVLDSRTLGTTPPVVAIDPRIGGSTIDREVSVSWTASDADGDRLSHTLQYSPNGSDWHPLRVNYEATGAISESMTLDLSSEAGSAGSNARIRVLTSDGFNTAVATSPAFTVAKRGPLVAITHPAAEQTFAAESSIPLRGFATDAEDGLIADDQFLWSTGQMGRSSEVAGLAPGLHALELTAADSDGLAGTNAISFTVAPLFVPAAGASLVLDGYCDDPSYAEASELPLTRYADGSRPTARVVHTSSGLWLCLTDLHEMDGRVGLLVDSENRRSESVQAGDFGYFVARDGTSSVRQGTGSDLDWADPSTLGARISDSGAVWSAELRIQRSAFGSFQKRVSLAVGHFAPTGSEAAIWPRDATMLSPRSWGQANLGLVPLLTAVVPEGTVLGEDDIALTVRGADFTVDNVVQWNGAAVSTTLVNTTTLTAQVPADLANAAGAYSVTVGMEGVDGLSTAATRFIVSNPRPAITGLRPGTAEEGAAAAVVTIDGTGFVEGSTVVWDGEPRTTTFLDPTQLSTSLTTAELAFSRTIAVLVDNPQPSVGPSNVVEFTIAPVATPTPTQTPTAVATPIPTQTSTAVPTSTPSQTPTRTPTAVSTPTMTPTQQPTAIATPTPTRTPTVVATPTPPSPARIHLPWLSKP